MPMASTGNIHNYFFNNGIFYNGLKLCTHICFGIVIVNMFLVQVNFNLYIKELSKPNIISVISQEMPNHTSVSKHSSYAEHQNIFPNKSPPSPG